MCDGCVLSLTEAIVKFQCRSESIKFLQNHGVLKNEVLCENCGNPAIFNEQNLFWRCQKEQKEKIGKKIIRKICNFKQSLRTDSWLRNSNMPPEKCCLFVTYYILLNPPHQTFLMNEFGMSSKTVCDWSNFIREALEQWAIENSAHRIGGPNTIVEIDEAKFGKRKYNRGRIIDGEWVFGGFQRECKDVFMEPVPDRSAETLLEIIKKRIRPGTTVMSDCWKAYNCLEAEGYKHLTVNHQINFVDPDTAAYTQNIERTWRDARSAIPKYGRRTYFMSEYIAEFLFRRHFPNHTERIHALFIAIKNIYEKIKSCKDTTTEQHDTGSDTEDSEDF